MSEDILKRLGEILKDEHNAFTRATAIAAQAEIMRLEERSKGLRRERDALRAELSAEREKSQKWIAKASEDWPEAINEIDRLRAELAKRDEVMKEAQEKLQPISALVDMTPSGFPDHDICPIRLGMARDLRKLRSRIDAALVNGCSDEKA